MDGWRLTRGMRTKERRRMGARVVIDYAKSQAKRETRQRITRGQTETSVESLSFICFSLCFSAQKKASPKMLSIFQFTTLLISLCASHPVSV